MYVGKCVKTGLVCQDCAILPSQWFFCLLRQGELNSGEYQEYPCVLEFSGPRLGGGFAIYPSQTGQPQDPSELVNFTNITACNNMIQNESCPRSQFCLADRHQVNKHVVSLQCSGQYKLYTEHRTLYSLCHTVNLQQNVHFLIYI